MNKILLYVEPGPHKRDQLVAWAADLVEAITANSENGRFGLMPAVGVVAGVQDCLEIGVAALGRGMPRTVEGGERLASPVTLFPFEQTPEEESRSEQAPAYACLQELADSGAVEGISIDAVEERSLPSAVEVLRNALERGDWQVVVDLGESEEANAVIRERMRLHMRTSVMRPLAQEVNRERVGELLRRIQPEIEDQFMTERQHAVQAAVKFATILEKLGLGSELGLESE